MLMPRTGRRDIIRAVGTTAEGQPRYTVENEGKYDFVKVLDFGIARMGAPGAAREDAHIFGTPEYMSPEAALGKDLDGRADVYALGVLFYEMLTGRVPFSAEAAMDVLQQQLHEPPRPPRQVAPDAEITTAAERLILRALEKEPARRPQNMDELRDELAGCYGTIAFRRDAARVPGGAPFAPARRRLTDELDEWLARENDRIERAVRGDLATAERVDDAGAADEAGPPDEPVLLTQRKPLG
jgi:serine/threonine-protein kinase